MSEGFLNKLIPGRGNGKGTTMMNEVGKAVASTSRPYDDSWKKYISNFPGGPIRRGNNLRGNSMNMMGGLDGNLVVNPMDQMNEFKYMLLCNKIGIGIKELTDKNLNDAAWDWRMRKVEEQKAARKAEAEAAKKKRR